MSKGWGRRVVTEVGGIFIKERRVHGIDVEVGEDRK